MSAYSRRNERAIAAGFTGYGEMRSAKRLGYDVAADYRAVRQAARSVRMPTPAASVELVVKAGQAFISPKAGAVGGGVAAGRALAGYLGKRGGRYYPTREDGSTIGGARGFSASYIENLLEEFDYDYDDVIAEIDYEDATP